MGVSQSDDNQARVRIQPKCIIIYVCFWLVCHINLHIPIYPEEEKKCKLDLLTLETHLIRPNSRTTVRVLCVFMGTEGSRQKNLYLICSPVEKWNSGVVCDVQSVYLNVSEYRIKCGPDGISTLCNFRNT